MVETVRRVVCDWCMKTGPDALESEDPLDLARSEGWNVNTDSGEEGTVCPDCLNKKGN